MKIGTHNSATGEKSRNLLSWLVIPFAKCQGKTISEQLDNGVRYFDLRVRLSKGRWVFAHGLWESSVSVNQVLEDINSADNAYVNITYEGKATDNFLTVVDYWKRIYSNISFCSINEKKPSWRQLTAYNTIPSFDNFQHLDFSSWHTFIPIPYLWAKLRKDKIQFNDKVFTFVDFY